MDSSEGVASCEPLDALIFAPLFRCRQDAAHALSVEHEQTATVPARGVPPQPGSADSRVAVEDNRRFFISQRVHLLGLLVIEANREVLLYPGPGDELAVRPCELRCLS